VQLFVEEGIPARMVAQELGINPTTVWEWAKRYKQYGESGLRAGYSQGHGTGVAAPVKAQIIQLKTENPQHGGKRISQILRRMFGFKASAETVRQHLKVSGIGTPKARVRKKPEPPQRRFEASTPNQMWQTDITYFPILG
jgi:transposase